MIEWKEKAFDTLLKIDRNTKVPKKIIKRVHNIITVMCAHCRVLYPSFNIYCYDKSLEVFPFADESGIELDHIFNSSVRSEAHFEILLNKQKKFVFDFITNLPKLEDIEIRISLGNIQWKYWKKKKWNNIEV